MKLVTVVSDEEAEKSAYVVCVPAEWKTPFTDNEIGECCKCKRKVQWRPYNPKTPPRICLECLPKAIAN